MTPTNPAAPPAGSAQATPEALAIVRKYGIDCLDRDRYEAREREAEHALRLRHPAVARVDAATRELRQALEKIRDWFPSDSDDGEVMRYIAKEALERTALR
jgi:hypothetical protein